MTRKNSTFVFQIIICVFLSSFSSFTLADILPDTDQHQCYDNASQITCPQPNQSFYGQDAQYLNAPQSFTKMDAAGNILPDSASEWAIVLDNTTGLMWEVKTTDGSIHDKNRTVDRNGAYNFEDILNDTAFGGFTDWRIPDLRELLFLANRSCYSPSINKTYFPNTRSGFYRSLTLNWRLTENIWGVDFSEGSADYKDKYGSYYLRAVRGESPFPHWPMDYRFIDNGNGTVTDERTGLMWQSQTTSEKMNWQNALNYCENLNFAGYDDWRLPTVNELQTLAFYTDQLSINPRGAWYDEFFSDTYVNEYWSSTTRCEYPDSAWNVHFYFGQVGRTDKSNLFHVIAVRDGLSCSQKTGLKASSCVKKSNWPGGLAGYNIDISSGAQILSRNLLTLNGALPLSFGLSYNSLLPAPGIVGRGWGISGGLQTFLEVRCKDAVVHWSPLRANLFITEDDTSYSSPDLACRYDKLIKNEDGTFTLALRSRAVYEFDADGKLTRMKNHVGQSVGLSYDTAGRLSKVIEPISGVFLNFAYNAKGFLGTVTDPVNRTVNLEYDDNGDLIKITNAKGHTTTYTYNPDGQVLKAVNADGHRLFENVYDEEGRVSLQDDGLDTNKKIKLSYDEDSEEDTIITTVTDRMGYSRVYRFDTDYQLTQEQEQEKDELNTSAQLTHDENGNVVSATDGNGNTTSFSYDSNGNLRAVTDAEGRTTGFGYNTVSGITISLKQHVRYNWAIPSGLSAGNYAFRVQVRQNGNAISPWSDSQTFSVGCSSVSAESVAINQLATDISGASCTGNINLQARILNTGIIPLPENSSAYFIITGPDGNAAAMGKADVSGLGAGVNTWFGYSWNVPDNAATGTYSYRVQVRSENGDSLSEWSGEQSFQVLCSGGTNNFVTQVSEVYPPENAACGTSAVLWADVVQTGGSGIPSDAKVWFCITGPDGKVVDAGYVREDRNLNSVTDAMGKTSVRLEYNEDNTVKSSTDAQGNVTHSQYDNNKQLSSVKSPKGNTTTYENEKGRTSKVTAPEGNFTQYQYDNAGRIIQAADAEGNTYTYQYDLNCGGTCREDRTTDPLGQTTRRQYDSRGSLIQSIDAKGNSTVYAYDANGNLLTATDAIDHVTSYEYDGEDRLTKTILPGNRVWQREYDAKGRLIKTTDPLGNERKTEYDNMYHVKNQTDAMGNKIQSVNRDKVYNTASVSDALNRSTSYQHDKLDRVTQVTDPKSQSTKLQYNDISQLTSVTDAKNYTATQNFDADGNLTEIQDAKGNRTEFSVDKNGRPTEQRSASGSSVKYGYDARSLMNKLTNGRNQNRTFQYDKLGRISQMSDPDGTISYTYDKNSNVLTVNDASGTITRQYDALNRIIRYTDAQGNVIQYAYDAAGNLATLTYPDGKQVNYAYDAADRLTSLTDWAGRITRYTYDANSRLIKTQRPDGSVMTRSYDSAGQMTQQKDITAGEIIAQYDFVYDANGNITQETVTPPESTFAVTPVTMSYTDANRLASYNGQSVSYDADGNMTHGPLDGGMADFSFDSRNRLTQAKDTQYVYDAEGNRIRMIQGGQTTQYVVNPNAGLSQLLMETAPDGTTSRYVYGLGLVGREQAGAYHAYHFDFRGSTVAMSDAGGNITHRYAYSPYGRAVSISEDSSNPFRYVGQYGVMWDDNGLYYMRARYYEPGSRRFINIDPIKDEINFYSYCSNNPINLLDPNGLFSWKGLWNNTVDFMESVGRLPGILVMGSVEYGVDLGYDAVSAGAYLAGYEDDFKPRSSAGRVGGRIGQKVAMLQTGDNSLVEIEASTIDYVFTALELSGIGPVKKVLLKKIEPVKKVLLKKIRPIKNFLLKRKINQKNIQKIEEHLRKLDALDDPANKEMLRRLKAGKISEVELRFVEHELIESRLMKGQQYSSYDVARDAHLKTLKKQGIEYKKDYEKLLYGDELYEKYMK